MNTTLKRMATLVLAMILALSCFAFVACSDDTPDQPGTPDQPNTDTPDAPGTSDGDASDDATAGTDYIMSIPKQNYGKTFTFLTTEGMREKEVYFESEDDAMGDLVETAIFYRNNRVAEHLGVDFGIITDPNGGWADKGEYINRVVQSYSAGDQDFSMVSVYMAYAAELAVGGYFYDANSIKAIDFESPWYVQSWQENTLINDRIYMVLSDLSYSMWQYINALYFNQQISDELGITETLYSLAADGNLTLEYVMECAALVAADDGNDVWDENDTYGICFNPFNCRAFLTYFDIPVVSAREDGEYELTIYSERTEDVFATMQNYIFNNNFVYMNDKLTTNHNDTSVTGAMFKEDRLLFLPAYLQVSQDLRDMDGAFGILPMPKYDEQQESYRSHSNDTFTVFAVPAHTEDAEFVGTVMDALSAENKYSVIPAYYDVVLKGRTTKDEQSVAMLDIIRDNLHFDFALAHLSSLDNMWTHFGGAVANKNNSSYSISYDANADKYQTLLEGIMDAYWDAR